MTGVIAVQLEGTDLFLFLSRIMKKSNLRRTRVIIMMKVMVNFSEVLIMFQILFQALYIYIYTS